MASTEFHFISRKQWTDQPPGGEAFHGPKRFYFLHHTAGPQPEGGRRASKTTEEALIRATRLFHVNGRGFSDIAYSFGVMPSGRAYVLRGNRTGGHTYGWNDRSLAIVGFGNYETAKVSEEMERAVKQSRKRLRKKRWLSRFHKFMGHRDVGAIGGGTACPGKNLYLLVRR